MLGVFKGAGFGVRRRGSYGELTVSLDITPAQAVQERIDERDHFAAVAALRPILAPSSVAVAGAAAAAGTMAHSFIEAFADEERAFTAFAEDFPGRTTFLVDTYDTDRGVRTAIEVARRLQLTGPVGVRLDSGDLAGPPAPRRAAARPGRAGRRGRRPPRPAPEGRRQPPTMPRLRQCSPRSTPKGCRGRRDAGAASE